MRGEIRALLLAIPFVKVNQRTTCQVNLYFQVLQSVSHGMASWNGLKAARASSVLMPRGWLSVTAKSQLNRECLLLTNPRSTVSAEQPSHLLRKSQRINLSLVHCQTRRVVPHGPCRSVTELLADTVSDSGLPFDDVTRVQAETKESQCAVCINAQNVRTRIQPAHVGRQGSE